MKKDRGYWLTQTQNVLKGDISFLSEREQKVYRLYIIKGFGIKDVANQLKITKARVLQVKDRAGREIEAKVREITEAELTQEYRSQLKKKFKNKKGMLNIPLEDLGFSNRAYNAMCKSQFKTIGDIARHNDEELLKIRGLGHGSLAQIKHTINISLGFTLDELRLINGGK